MPCREVCHRRREQLVVAAAAARYPTVLIVIVDDFEPYRNAQHQQQVSADDDATQHGDAALHPFRCRDSFRCRANGRRTVNIRIVSLQWTAAAATKTNLLRKSARFRFRLRQNRKVDEYE